MFRTLYVTQYSALQAPFHPSLQATVNQWRCAALRARRAANSVPGRQAGLAGIGEAKADPIIDGDVPGSGSEIEIR